MASIYRNRQLTSLSVFLFLYFASIGCLAPFLTSHMRHLGFSLSEISFINAVSAFFSVIGPFFTIIGLGVSFPKSIGRFKFTTVFFIILGALAFVAISFVPRYDKLHYRPLVDFDCESGLRVERCVNWVTCGEALNTSDDFNKVKFSNCHYQCSKSGHFIPPYPLHLCFHGDHGNICVVFDEDNRNNSLAVFESPLKSWPYIEVPAKSNATLTNFSNQSLEEDVPRAHVAMCNFLPLTPIMFNQKRYEDFTCRPSKDDCSIHCAVEFMSGGVINSCEEAFGNPDITFWCYLVLRCIGDMCLLTVICLLDAITTWSTIDYEGSYGRLHVWAALGMAVLAPLSGTLIDYLHERDGRMDFSWSTYTSGALAILCCFFVIILPILKTAKGSGKDIEPAKGSGKDPKGKSFFTVEMFIFMLLVLLLGTQWSILFTFLPWLSMDIGCTALQMGLGTTLMFGFSVPFLLISKNMMKNIGKANLLVFALLFYFTRYAGITFVSSPWWTLPFSLMGCFTLCVMWIATVFYGQKLAPTGCSLIMQYLLNILHFGIGRGIGSLAAGTLISRYSLRVVFCGIAVFSASVAFLYLTIYHVGIKNKHKPTKNSNWHLLQTMQSNGDAKCRQPKLLADLDEDFEMQPSHGQNNNVPNNK